MKIKNASHQMKNRIGQSYGMKNAKSLFYLPSKLNFLKRYYSGNIILVNLIIHKIRRLVVEIKTSCIILYNIFLERVAHILESSINYVVRKKAKKFEKSQKSHKFCN